MCCNVTADILSLLLIANSKERAQNFNVVVAEWLRRWTRNPLGSSRAGSNPADNANFLIGGCHELKPKNIRISDDLVKEYIV